MDRLHAAAISQDRIGSVIEAGALRALARAASGDDAAAVNALAGVLALACPEGYVRVIADEGPPMAALLARLAAAQKAGHTAAARVPLGYLVRLQRGFDADHASTDGAKLTAVVSALVEQLTSRELEVLRMRSSCWATACFLPPKGTSPWCRPGCRMHSRPQEHLTPICLSSSLPASSDSSISATWPGSPPASSRPRACSRSRPATTPSSTTTRPGGERAARRRVPDGPTVSGVTHP